MCSIAIKTIRRIKGLLFTEYYHLLWVFVLENNKFCTQYMEHMRTNTLLSIGFRTIEINTIFVKTNIWKNTVCFLHHFPGSQA